MTRSTNRARIGRLHDAMAARVAKDELPGIVLLIGDRDDAEVDVIGAMAFGGEPLRRDTIFRIASMTKPVLAVATMLLVEDGLLALDEPVDRLAPELADRRVLRRIDGPLDDTVPANRPITIEDLLTFRMGYGMVFEPAFEPPYPVITAAAELDLVMGPPDPPTPLAPDEWLRRFATLPLMCQPGERWQYNAGALVLSVVAARAAGQSLPDLFRTRVFEPLGMRDSGFWLPAEQADRIPAYYMTNPETGKLELQSVSTPAHWTSPPVFPAGSAGLLSTVDDYLAFARMLLDKGTYRGERLLQERSVELLTTNHLTPEQVAAAPLLVGKGWGYGMAVSVEPDEVSAPGRYGWEGGYGSTWFNDPNQDLIAIAMSQTSDFLFNGGMAEFWRLAGHPGD
jgi:CubicO group peptidase (beta-lactamase class C family)